MGIKLSEGAGDLAKTVGPKLVAFNVRRMLRSGVRQALVKIVQKIGGRVLARKLTEKALMRLLVPGINIPISAGMNYAFTRSILTGANKRMLRRGAVVGPLAQLHHHVPELPRDAAIKALIAVLEAPGRPDGWEEGQLDALRHTQGALRLDDDAVGRLDGWFDKTPDDVVSELPSMSEKGGRALVEYLATASALGRDHGRDHARGPVDPTRRTPVRWGSPGVTRGRSDQDQCRGPARERGLHGGRGRGAGQGIDHRHPPR
jgi:hypothetical protein